MHELYELALRPKDSELSQSIDWAWPLPTFRETSEHQTRYLSIVACVRRALGGMAPELVLRAEDYH
jgi:hypothetical protein